VVRDQVFISYSHQDKRSLDDLLTHLKPLLRTGAIAAWSDEQIKPGSKWFEEIEAALAKTAAAVMLVSPDFLASDFIHEHELGPLLKAAEAGGVTILWVLIRDCLYQETPLAHCQAVVSPPEKPFAQLRRPERDTAWRKVCEAIKQAAELPLTRAMDSAGAAAIREQEMEPAGPKRQDQPRVTAAHRPVIAQTTNSTPIVSPPRVICPLHGIRTLAVWQKGLSDLASSHGWVCRLDRWSYGRFSLLAFVTPWSREAKLGWLRRQYDAEIHDRRLLIEEGQSPSVVAHSFGTYILGYTLLRFDFIRFNKVILCGCILPRDFPWDKLIERGQVQAVRNEYGVRDPWVKRVRCFVGGTGPSGASGFTCQHDRLEQEEFEYDHGDYFGIDHMEDRWIPFLDKPLEEIPRSDVKSRIPRPQTSAPWCLYGLVLAALFMTVVLGGMLRRQRESHFQPVSRPSVLGGDVRDVDGTPLAGVALWIDDWYKTDGSRPDETTDERGRFLFENLEPSTKPEQQVRVRASKSGYRVSDEYARIGSHSHPITLYRVVSPEDSPRFGHSPCSSSSDRRQQLVSFRTMT
jgi:TIR domain